MVCQDSLSTFVWVITDLKSLTFWSMEIGHLRTTPKGTKIKEIHNRGSQLLHQMVGSWGNYHDHWNPGRELWVEEHHLPFWNSPRLCHGHGKQFNNPKFKDFCERLAITPKFSSVAHPQANRQIESQNKDILTGLKRRLKKAKGKWAEEHPGVLWAHKTKRKETIVETPFSLAFGTKAFVFVKNQGRTWLGV